MSSFCRCDDSIVLLGAPEVLPIEANLKVESNASLSTTCTWQIMMINSTNYKIKKPDPV